jgi:hypothetical protein
VKPTLSPMVKFTKLTGILAGITSARNLNLRPSANRPVKTCGSSMNMTQCASSPICIWNANLEKDKCVLDNDVENDPTRLARIMENLIKLSGVDKLQTQVEDKGFNENSDKNAGLEKDEKKAAMRSKMRSSPIFGTNQFNNPFMQQQRQQSNSWLNNMFAGNNNNFGMQNQFGFNNQLGNQLGNTNNLLFGQVQNMQNLLAKNPVCPVNVPLCKREACQIENPSLDMNAFACGQIKGCCFDMNLFLYKQMFGFDQMYQNTPICHRAVKSNVYEWYTNQISGPVWMPQFSESVIAKLEAFDQKNPEQWGVLEGCPYNKETMAPLALQIIQRFKAVNMGGLNGGGMAGMGNMNMLAGMANMANINPMMAMAMSGMTGNNGMTGMTGMNGMTGINGINGLNALNGLNGASNPVSPGLNSGMNPMMYLAMQSGGGGDAKAFLQAVMMAQMAGNNPLVTLMSLKENEGTLRIINDIIVNLSSSYGWEGISRFECQMYGGCWLADENNFKQGECLKPFSMDDWQDDAELLRRLVRF